MPVECNSFKFPIHFEIDVNAKHTKVQLERKLVMFFTFKFEGGESETFLLTVLTAFN